MIRRNLKAILKSSTYKTKRAHVSDCNYFIECISLFISLLIYLFIIFDRSIQ